MRIICFECGKKFVPGEFNTQIIGPDVEINCPFCFYKYKGKLTSFVRDQFGGKPKAASEAAAMIEMAQFIELNSSNYYKDRGLRYGGKKKVRNLRNRRKS